MVQHEATKMPARLFKTLLSHAMYYLTTLCIESSLHSHLQLWFEKFRKIHVSAILYEKPLTLSNLGNCGTDKYAIVGPPHRRVFPTGQDSHRLQNRKIGTLKYAE